MLGELVFRCPNPLPVQRHMHAALSHLRVAATRLHRIDDDPVVFNLHINLMRGTFEGRFKRILVAQRPIERDIVWGDVVHRCATSCEVHMHGQLVIIELDQLNRVFRFL